MSDTPVPTKRKICPVLSPVTVSPLVGSDGSPPGAQMYPVQCQGPDCQWWRHNEDLPPETGDCSMPLAMIASAANVGSTIAAGNNVAVVADNVTELARLVKFIAERLGVKFDPAPTPPTA